MHKFEMSAPVPLGQGRGIGVPVRQALPTYASMNFRGMTPQMYTCARTTPYLSHAPQSSAMPGAYSQGGYPYSYPLYGGGPQYMTPVPIRQSKPITQSSAQNLGRGSIPSPRTPAPRVVTQQKRVVPAERTRQAEPEHEEEIPSKRARLSLDGASLPQSMRNFHPLCDMFYKLRDMEKKMNDLSDYEFMTLPELVESMDEKKKKSDDRQYFLRVYAYNTNNESLTSDETLRLIENPALYVWTLCIRGEVVMRSEEEETVVEHIKFTDIVDKIVLELESTSADSNETRIEWAREVNDAGKDGVTIRRCFSLQISDDKNMKQTDDLSGQIPEEGGGANGDSDLVSDLEFPITINLYISEYPPRYVVNDRLRTVFGMENRAYSLREILDVFWLYVLDCGLLDREDPQFIVFNPALRSLFDVERCHLHDVLEEIERFVTGMPPVSFEHLIRMDARAENTAALYEVELCMDEKTVDTKRNDSVSGETEILRNRRQEIGSEMFSVMDAINVRYTKICFLKSFVESPLSFTDKFLQSQSRDIHEVARECRHERERKASYYEEKWVPEAIHRFVDRYEV